MTVGRVVRPPRRTLPVAAGIVLVMLAALIAGLALVQRMEAGADAAWLSATADLAGHVAQLPTADESSRAAAVRAAAADWGIPFRPASGLDTPASRSTVASAPSKQARAFLAEVVRADESPGPAPPAELVAWVEAHHSDAEALVAACVDGDEPLRWAARPAEGIAAPGAPVAGLSRAIELLAARALVEGARGHREGAERSLEAAWLLHGSLAEHPSSRAAWESVRLLPALLGALRHVSPGDAVAWTGLLDALRPRDWVLRGLAVDAGALRLVSRDAGWRAPPAWRWLPEDVRQRIVPPNAVLTRAVLEDVVGRLGTLREILSARSPCLADTLECELPAFGILVGEGDPAGRVLAQHVAAWQLAVRAEADAWFTRRVLVERAAEAGVVAPVGATEPPPACERWSIVLEVRVDGAPARAILFAGDLPPSPPGLGLVPDAEMRFVISR